MLDALTKKVRGAFSNAASRYDVLAGLQHEIGKELLQKITKDDFATILDVGTGTGRQARRLKFYYPEATVTAIDFAWGMLEEAKKKSENLTYINADAHALPFQNDKFDLVVSNLVYQWSKQLSVAFQETRRVLKKEGVFVTTIFGNETLYELFDTMNAASGMSSTFQSQLPMMSEIEAALKNSDFQCDELYDEFINIEYTDIWELLSWLKSIGANVMPQGSFIGRDLLQKANQIYKEKYPYHQGINVTFHVIWLKSKAV